MKNTLLATLALTSSLTYAQISVDAPKKIDISKFQKKTKSFKKKSDFNDPLWEQQWGPRHVSLPEVWKSNKGHKDIVIAVIDSGVDYNHPELRNNMWANEKELNGRPGVDDDGNGYVDDIYGYDFANKDGDPMDDYGHGTHCAGIIGATHNNGEGIVGVMDDVSIMAVKFLDKKGNGENIDAAKSIDYAVKMGADIISASWAGPEAAPVIKKAIERAEKAGVLFVAAAGNDKVFSRDNDMVGQYPTNYKLSNILSVASIKPDSELSSFSHFGRTSVHIAAPGDEIISTLPDNSYGVKSGTSMAAPMVAGIVGLLYAKEGKQETLKVIQRVMRTSTFHSKLRKRLISDGYISAYDLLEDNEGERPKLTGWKTYKLPKVIESTHPYTQNQVAGLPVWIPEAKYIRAKIKRYEFAEGDVLEIADMNNMLVEKIDGGSEEDYTTTYVEGHMMIIRFHADRWVHRWGFAIEEVEYID